MFPFSAPVSIVQALAPEGLPPKQKGLLLSTPFVSFDYY